MLEHDGVTLTESLVVAEYVADAFDGGTNLLPPDDALARATSRLAIELNPFGYFGLLKARAVRDADGGAAERAATDELRAALKGFDAFLGTHARGDGPFMFDEFGLVEARFRVRAAARRAGSRRRYPTSPPDRRRVRIATDSSPPDRRMRIATSIPRTFPT